MPDTYTAGWNSPGCLPEVEPAQFETPEDAFTYLANEVETFWEQDDGGCLDGLKSGRAMNKWGPVIAAIKKAENAPFTVVTNDRAMALWVEVIQ